MLCSKHGEKRNYGHKLEKKEIEGRIREREREREREKGPSLDLLFIGSQRTIQNLVKTLTNSRLNFKMNFQPLVSYHLSTLGSRHVTQRVDSSLSRDAPLSFHLRALVADSL
jgi:hypothetical protein